MDQPRSSVSPLSRVAQRWTPEAATFGIMAVATLAVWGHTIDEIRIGELSAIPAGVLNIGLVAGWQRLGNRSRGWLAVLFGLFWTLTVIPYHVVPLLQGISTWQNVSGLLRVAGGVGMTVAGTQTLRRGSGRDDES